MFKKTPIGLAAALVACAGLGSIGPAAAQGSSTAVSGGEQRVEVTGTRIIRNDLVSNSPLYSVGLDALGLIGSSNFADLAPQLPQFAPAFGNSRTQSTFSGAATSGLNLANLRNLGSQRSLVLINGRRAAGGTSITAAPDFNNLPTANIETIEIITGGASAVYGADAVSGVINIVTRKKFSGVEVGLRYGEAERGDNTNPSAYLMFGGRIGERGHGLFTVEVDRQGHVSCRDRELCAEDFDWRAVNVNAPLRGPGAYSGVGLGGRFFVGNNSYTRRGNSLTDANGNLIPFVLAVDGYNRNADRDIAIPTQRRLMAAEVEYAITPTLRAFGELNHGVTTVDSKFEGHPFQSQQPGSLFGTLQATIPINNPFIPAPLAAAIAAHNAAPPAGTAAFNEMTWWQRFNDAGGARGASNDRSMLRTAFGLKGDLPSLGGFGRDWRWELSHVYGRTTVNLNTEGLVNTSNLYYGLRVEADPANPGQFRCDNAAARTQGCVPINPFAPYTPEMQRALGIGSMAIGRSTLNDTIASITGTLLDLPAGALRMAVGAERRSFGGYLDRDVVVNNALATGNQISDTDFAKTTVNEVFVEALVPLLADKPFVNSLNLDTAFRRSDTDKSSYDTWKFGGDWEPVSGLRVRAMQARSVRAPEPTELSGVGLTAGVINDPCTAANRGANPVRAANCLADGVPANYAPPLVVEQGVSGLTGGNPNLTPEQATTSTFGIVFQPRQIKGLSIALDRFEIKMKDVITQVARQTSADLCYDTVARTNCNLLTRGSNPVLPGATWVLLTVNENLQNLATLHVRGTDLDLRYGFGLGGWGQLDLKLIATIYDKATLARVAGTPVLDLLDQAGGSTIDQGFVKQTANLTAGWRMGRFNATWNVRHIGSAEMNIDSAARGFPRIPSHSYHNLRVGFNVMKDSEIFAGVTNAADKQPPVFGSGRSGTQALDTIPGYYDVFGRQFYVGARARF
jgi:iron complex outermembrane recepter protein